MELLEPVHFFSGRLLTYKSSVLSTGVDDLRRAPTTWVYTNLLLSRLNFIRLPGDSRRRGQKLSSARRRSTTLVDSPIQSSNLGRLGNRCARARGISFPCDDDYLSSARLKWRRPPRDATCHGSVEDVYGFSPNWRLPTMCRSVLIDRDLEGRALALAPFVRWSLSHLLTWFRRPVAPLGSRIAGCYLDCERRPTALSDGGITTIISIYCKDRRGISTDPRGEGRPGAESEVCKRFLGCQSDVHQTDWISPTNHQPTTHPKSEGTQVFIAFWGRGGRGHDVTTARARAIITQARGTALTHGWVLFLAPSESLSTGPAGRATKERNCGGRPQLVPPWHMFCDIL